jgi:hypothetical protein
MTTSNTGHGAMREVKPGSDEHLQILMAPQHLQFLSSTDRADVLAYGRTVWQAALSSASSGSGVLTAERDEARAACIELAHKVSTLEARAILAATQRAEPVAQSGVEGYRWNEPGIQAVHALLCTSKLPPYELACAIKDALNAAPPAAADTPQDVDERHSAPKGMSDERRAFLDRVQSLAARPAAPLSEDHDQDAPTMREWVAAIKQAHDESLDGLHESARCLLRDVFEEMEATPSPSPQPTDEATDAGRLAGIRDELDQFDSYCVSQHIDGESPSLEAYKILVRCIAARLATPPDNAAGGTSPNGSSPRE